MQHLIRIVASVAVWLLNAALLPAALQVSPTKVILDSPETTQQLIVTGGTAAAPLDLTRTVTYKVANPAIAGVDASGLVEPKAEGATEIVITQGGEQARLA